MPRPTSTSSSHRARRLALLPALLLPASLVLAACGSSTDSAADATASASTASESAAASSDPNAVVVYSGRSEELVAPLFDAFTAETGIALQVRYGDTAELAAQLVEEGDASPADLFFGQDAGALGALDTAGLCGPLPEAAATAVPELYRSADGTWTGITGRARVIAYDPAQVPADAVPTSIFDLTDPKWKDKVAIAPTNGSFQAFVTAMRVSQGDDVTREWLQGLVDNGVQTFEKNTQVRDAVDTGQAAIGLINHYYWYEKAAEVGAENVNVQIAFAKPGDPGALVNVAGACVINGSENADGAGSLISWMLEPAQQTWFAETTWEYPLVEGVASPEGIPPLADLQGPDIALAELADLPGTLTMLQDVGLT